MKKVETTLQIWKMRDLSLTGKIQIVNSLIASLFIYVWAVIPMMPIEVHEKLIKIVNEFLWNGKRPKISYRILSGNKQDGGAGLCNFQNREKALKLQWLWKAHDNTLLQQFALASIASPIGMDVWCVNLAQHDFTSLFPKINFWVDVLKIWNELNYQEPKNKAQVMNQMIWFNSHIKISKKPVFYKKWYEAGVVRISDLWNNDSNQWMSYDDFQRQHSLTTPFTLYIGILQAIPKSWRDIMQVNTYGSIRLLYNMWNNCSKKASLIYKHINHNDNLIYAKWIKVQANVGYIPYSDYVKVIENVKQITISEKLRSFHYRFVMYSVITNIQLKMFNFVKLTHVLFVESILKL